MRKAERIPEVLARLQRIWEKYPDLRLGQLLCNVARDPTLYFLEDNELLDAAEQLYGLSAKDVDEA